MTPNPDLDVVILRARHLLFAFDGPICRVDEGKPVNQAAPTAPHIHDALTACRESGRLAAVVSTNPPSDVRAYMDAHDLLNQITTVAASVAEAATALEAAPPDCLLITSSPADIKAAKAAGTPAVAYARTPQDAAHLTEIGITSFVYSMADLALSLRTNRKGGNS
jgi:beta-phosphoglucomutase-like phosphatase (HAD superfamily)